MKFYHYGSDTRAEIGRILGKLEFRSGLALAKFLGCLVAACLIAFLPEYPGLDDGGRWTLAIVGFCGLLWMTEALPAFAVALLAIGLQILILGRPGGVMAEAEDVKAWERFVEPWASPSMWLFFGGFVLARAASRTGLDSSLASRLMLLGRGDARQLLLVSMLTTFIFSMFLSNTATAAMMVAILGPVLMNGAGEKASRAMMIGVAFSANLGGMGTIIGTPPNAIASALLAEHAPIDFLRWIAFGFPPAIVMVMGLWWMLSKQVQGAEFQLDLRSDPSDSKMSEMRPDQMEDVARWQKGVLVLVFLFTVGLWLSGGWHGIPTAVVSFFPIVALSITGVIRAVDIRSLNWDILILLAGGLSLGVGVAESGLADWIAGQIEQFPLPAWALTAAFALVTFVLSNFMSNTAASNILIPVGLAAGLKEGGEPEAIAFSISMALAASAAMVLPISTPPNAIAYSGDRLAVKDFLVPGLIVGLVGVPLAVLWTRLMAGWMF
ncbi:MAG: DASS family sodium-coupled anion symporter [Verrucomicrobiota bacterium]